jgi:hypothetical protein
MDNGSTVGFIMVMWLLLAPTALALIDYMRLPKYTAKTSSTTGTTTTSSTNPRM